MNRISEHTIANAEKTNFGFWLYIMTDCMLFAALFAAYIVLHNNIATGPAGIDIFEPKLVLAETIILLTSSLTAAVAFISAKHGSTSSTLRWLVATSLLGILFLGIELSEFQKLISESHSWRESAFLSSFFTLVGTHGLHILTGLIWAATLIKTISSKGLDNNLFRKLGLFSLFWHFLDVIWIFIFTIVYMTGLIG